MQPKVEVEVFTRQINGDPYHFTRVARGWRITAVTPLGHAKPSRSYLVQTKTDGSAMQCDCPSYHRGRRLC